MQISASAGVILQQVQAQAGTMDRQLPANRKASPAHPLLPVVPENHFHIHVPSNPTERSNLLYQSISISILVSTYIGILQPLFTPCSHIQTMNLYHLAFLLLRQ